MGLEGTGAGLVPSAIRIARTAAAGCSPGNSGAVKSGTGPARLRAATSATTAAGAGRSAAGLVEAAQRPPTARGTVFVCLDDGTGLANVTVPPPLAARRMALLAGGGALLVEGVIRRVDGAVDLLATELALLPAPVSRPHKLFS